MASIFTKIVQGEIPCYKIAENKNFLAFLDVFPLAKGHVLVIPKKETDYIFDIEDEEYRNFWSFTKEVSKAIKKTMHCERVGIAVIGLEVPHAHIHLIPLQSVEDINFTRPKLKVEATEMTAIADKISAAF
jgi:histidine triad (HIT) family protein